MAKLEGSTASFFCRDQLVMFWEVPRDPQLPGVGKGTTNPSAPINLLVVRLRWRN
jgi:hypothetical protein